MTNFVKKITIGSTFKTLLVGGSLLASSTALAADLTGQGFSIQMNKGASSNIKSATKADAILSDVDIQVRYDALYIERMLNVVTSDLASAIAPGSSIGFTASSNYPDMIERAELRLIAMKSGRAIGTPQIISMSANGTTNWTVPATDKIENYRYALRVYDAKGNFDETHSRDLRLESAPTVGEKNGPILSAGLAEDNTAIRNIPTLGGMVTVSGRDLPTGASVRVLGSKVVIDEDGKFVHQRQMPFGRQTIDVAMTAPGQRGISVERDIKIPRSQWFYAGQAEVTILRRSGENRDVRTTEEGRIAGYAKGLINGNTRITASIDTGEEELDHLFDNFLSKRPREVLDRLDTDDLYPTYGDDSTIINDAPTSGALFLRAERAGSFVQWGDFLHESNGTTWMDTSRNLYGFQGHYESKSSTDEGERLTEAVVYAANPESLPGRDILRGTGGSTYFLHHRDLLPGSETMLVEVLDPDTGRIVSRQRLVRGSDYRIDYLQGTIILGSPLSGSVGTGSVVSRGVLGENNVNLVAQYEYRPTGLNLDGAAIGGRAQTWLPGERIRFGVSGLKETTGDVDLNILSADALLRLGQGSQITAEIVQSEGSAFTSSTSTFGGLNFDEIAATGSADTATAVRIAADLDLSDALENMDGEVNAWFEDLDAGFTTLSTSTLTQRTNWGVKARLATGNDSEARMSFENFKEAGGREQSEGSVEYAQRLTKTVTAEVGVRFLDNLNMRNGTETGTRTDLGARLTLETGEDNELYAIAQTTVDVSGNLSDNDRYGVGGLIDLSERVTVGGEISEGTEGFGARGRVDFKPSEDARYFLGYELDPDREISGYALNGSDQGRIIVGAERNINDRTTMFGENSYDMFGRRRSLASSYGIRYTPDDRWSASASIEHGLVRDDLNGDFDRTGVSVGFKFDNASGQRLSLRTEYSVDDHETDDSRDRDSVAVVGTYSHQVHEDWRLLTRGEALISESDQGGLLDGHYIEASLGMAYRPIASDRINALVRYTFLNDMPGADQVGIDGTTGSDKQRSHIPSADVIWEVSPQWEIGGKLAYRSAQTAERGTDNWTKNDALLAAVRGTYHVTHRWDMTAELRRLELLTNDASDTGVALTAYRHLGSKAKLGVGYNFGSFSDDLRDITLDDEGVFVNLVAKF